MAREERRGFPSPLHESRSRGGESEKVDEGKVEIDLVPLRCKLYGAMLVGFPWIWSRARSDSALKFPEAVGISCGD